MITEFTPYSAVLGGLLIGFAVLILLLGLGRIAGISGIISRLFKPVSGDISWRLCFLVGLILGPVISVYFGVLAPQAPQGSPVLLVIAGLLVGIGTVLGSGCTSGHGVCGISRFSIRSVVATVTFMLTAMITVFVVGA